MAGKVIINSERCKGCGLCVAACPKGVIEVSDQSNTYGYFPAVARNDGCTACTKCAVICPDACIKVVVEGKIKAVESGGVRKEQFVKEKS